MLDNAIINIRCHYDNLAKHGVVLDEVEECFCDSGKILWAASGAYWLIAKTQAGRLLEIGFIKESNDSTFVFHAMNARPYQHKQYKRRGK